ncbi:MAG: two-component system response regulator AtoC [Rhodothermales bacterium]
MKHILVIDDEAGTRYSMRAIFSSSHRVSLAADGAEGRALFSTERPDLVLLDVMLPDINGVDMLAEIRALYPTLPVILVTASKDAENVKQAVARGDCEYVVKPFDVEQLRQRVERVLNSSAMQRKINVLEDELRAQFPIDGLIGNSPEFQAAIGTLRAAAVTDATILISGESGTGKELAARLVHDLSPRSDEPFVPVHCAGIPENLLESELFGHEKGAFTGASQRKLGRFDLAGAGTLLFDEVGEMSLGTQVKLLRVLEGREFTRVGGTKVIPCDARIVAATNRDLAEAVSDKSFREDLYYRLNVVPVCMPPLRQRCADIAPLLAHFLASFQKKMNVRVNAFSASAMARLQDYAWPGNIRELRNLVERMLVLHGQQEVIDEAQLPLEILGGLPAANSAPQPSAPAAVAGRLSLEQAVNRYERELILDALRQTDGIQTRAAELLGTTRRILKYRMQKLGIDC